MQDIKPVDNLANRENVLDLLITITRRRGDNEQWIRWSTEKVDLCRLLNIPLRCDGNSALRHVA